jgi:hypothetical protein
MKKMITFIIAITCSTAAFNLHSAAAEEEQLAEQIRTSLQHNPSLDGHEGDKFYVPGGYTPTHTVTHQAVDLAYSTAAGLGEAIVHTGCNAAKAAKVAYSAPGKKQVISAALQEIGHTGVDVLCACAKSGKKAGQFALHAANTGSHLLSEVAASAHHYYNADVRAQVVAQQSAMDAPADEKKE